MNIVDLLKLPSNIYNRTEYLDVCVCRECNEENEENAANSRQENLSRYFQ
jgi:hypothetical protein